MNLKHQIKRLEESTEFKSWRTTHEDSFLAHVFVMMDEANKGIIQVGYYSGKNQKMSTFMLTENTISVTIDAEVLRSEDELLELDLNQVNISSEDALKKSAEVKEEHYKKEPLIKEFFILQTIDKKPVYNITFITQSLKTLNIRISAGDGTTVKHSLDSLIHMPPKNDK